MILKIRKDTGFIYIDNIYRIDVEKIKKASVRGTTKGIKATWIEDGRACEGNEEGFHITVQHVFDVGNIRTIKTTSYVVDSGYLLNDKGGTVEGIHK